MSLSLTGSIWPSDTSSPGTCGSASSASRRLSATVAIPEKANRPPSVAETRFGPKALGLSSGLALAISGLSADM